MHHGVCLLLGIAMLSGASVEFHAQTEAPVPICTVSYVDVRPSARSTMVDALRRYRDASRQEDGHVALDLFEQVGWAGRFVVVEKWRDQKAVDAHAAAMHTTQFQSALQAIRVSGYDQRPYTVLNEARPAGTGGGEAVHIIAHVDAAPKAQGGKADAVTLLHRLAEASRKEPGNLRFDVLQHAMRGNHFTVVESWRDQSARDIHAAADHTRQYRDELQPISGSPLDERLYTAVE